MTVHFYLEKTGPAKTGAAGLFSLALQCYCSFNLKLKLKLKVNGITKITQTCNNTQK